LVADRALLAAALLEPLADVAVATAAEQLLLVAEVAEDEVVPAAPRLDVAQEIAEEAPLPIDELLRRSLPVATAHLDQPAPQADVGRAGDQPAEGGFAVAPRAPDLLVVRLARAGRRDVHDGADVRPIDAHPERVGGDDDVD